MTNHNQYGSYLALSWLWSRSDRSRRERTNARQEAVHADSRRTEVQTAATEPGDCSGVEVLPVQGNVYLIATGKGSNIVAQVGDQGALLVDASVPDVSDQVIAEIRKLTKGPSRVLSTRAPISTTSAATRSFPRLDSRCSPATSAYGPAPQATIFAHEKALNQISAPTGQTSAVPHGPLADRHVLRREEEDLLQPRAD